MKIPKLVPYGDFIFVQIDENPTITIKIRVNLLAFIEMDYIKWLKTNTNLFPVSPYKMPDKFYTYVKYVDTY